MLALYRILIENSFKQIQYKYFYAFRAKRLILHLSVNQFQKDLTKQTFSFQNNMEKTIQQYDQVISICRNIFSKKMTDYGTAWRILRPTSLTDQIYIKAQRIRSIEEKGVSKVDEGVRSEFIGVINYSIMGLIQLELGSSDEEMPNKKTQALYDTYFEQAKTLMMAKNHDYGEAWRNMRISSYTDLILMKLKRTKQIEDNKGQTLISEGIDANYLDMINYAVFAMIKIEFENEE